MRQQPKLWDSQREGEKKGEERENFPVKSSKLRHCLPTHRTQDSANTRGELDGNGPAHPPPARGKWATARARRQGANLAPETASSTKLRAGSQLLTESS